MATVSTTRMSSRGQVVIPQEIREKLGLRPGTQFVVLGQGDSVILKTLEPPSPVDFDRLIKKAEEQARRAGLKPSDVEAAVRRVRARK